MGALPRPDLPPGAHRDLVDALHDLHHRAGWPSLRRIAAAAQYSHTTVSAVFSTDRLPSWDVLAAVVTALDGDEEQFHALWLAATTPDDDTPPPPQLAGRRDEVATLRRFTHRHNGLFLVLGQPGIGKTRLLQAATEATDGTVVLATRCLPLSHGEPLMPIAALLRTALRHDDGTWINQALAECAPFVRGSLPLLLPELDVPDPTPSTTAHSEWARQRLFTAISLALAALTRARPDLVAVFDDLHWADDTTLDYLDYHLADGQGPPLLAAWRTDDPDIPRHAQRWRTRVTRQPSVETLRLQPLSRDETAEQLRLLGTDDPAAIEQIHARSQGLPLFTEHLARQTGRDDVIPVDLSDLLKLRLDGLSDPARAVATTLAVMSRPVAAEHLDVLTGRDADQVSIGLRELAASHLMAGSDDAALGHPLLCEAFRQDMAGTELTEAHRRVATILASLHDTDEDVSPAEIAQHWQRAHHRRNELAWRIRAAQSDEHLWALSETCAHWTRALELWPPDQPELTEPPLRRATAQLAALTALWDVDRRRGLVVARQAVAELGDRRDIEAAEMLQLASYFEGAAGDPSTAARHLERSLAALRELGPSTQLIEALLCRWFFLHTEGGQSDRNDPTALLVEAEAVCRRLGTAHHLRSVCALMAGDDLLAGDRAAADAHLAASAPDPRLEDPDPIRRVRTCLNRTWALLIGAASADTVLDAAEPALALARQWHLGPPAVSLLRANVAIALLDEGRVEEATRFVTEGDHLAPTIDLLQGRVELAVERTLAQEQQPVDRLLANELERVQARAIVYLWAARPAPAAERGLDFLARTVPSGDAGVTARLLVVTARAVADLHTSDAGSPAARRAHQRLERLLDQAAQDPFAPLSTLPTRRPLAAQWTGELQRLDGRPDPSPWLTAAAQWDRLTHPHDSAYCRWRAAQAAAATGQGTQAARLVRRALTDARTHVPLRRALTEELDRLTIRS